MPDDLSHDFRSFHELSWKSIDGKEVSFDEFKGKMCLCLNVARD